MYRGHVHSYLFFFFFNDTATTEIYTLSLHDALPILQLAGERQQAQQQVVADQEEADPVEQHGALRSEEHTSELQSQSNLVCRLLLEKKKNKSQTDTHVADPTRVS